jgi:hypothetical protein
MMAKCVICGAEFPDAMVQTPVDSRMKTAPKLFQKQICDECVSAPNRRSGIVREPGEKIEPYADLAGDIMHGVMEEYSTAYEKALESAMNLSCIELDMLTDAEVTFLTLHRSLRKSFYHGAITMGYLPGLLDSARREVEKQKRFKDLLKQGYDVFKR